MATHTRAKKFGDYDRLKPAGGKLPAGLWVQVRERGDLPGCEVQMAKKIINLFLVF